MYHIVRSVTVILYLVLLSACGGADSSETNKKAMQDSPAPLSGHSTTVPEQSDEPVYGGRIVIGSLGEPTNLVTALSTDNASRGVTFWLYISLLKYDKDLRIIPWAAESYDVEEGGRLLRFRLRKGIKWQDGVELTADDIEFTYKLMTDPKTPTAYASDFLRVKELRKIDRYTLEVHYEEPFARSLITWMSDILPKHRLEGEDLRSTAFLRNPMGAGPYRLKEWVAGSRVVLEANEDYFEGRPYIDEIVFRNIPDMTTMFLELKAGKIDMMDLTAQQYTFQTTGKQWDSQWQKFRYLSSGYTFLGFNLERPPFEDVQVRRALSLGVDRKAIIAAVLLGEGHTTVGPYKPGTWVYNETLDEYPYNPRQARALLAQAGFVDGDGDGIVERDGVPFAFTILTNQGNGERIKAATIIQSQLKEIGVDVQIRVVEWAAFIKEFVHKGRFDALMLGWNILQDPDITMVWHSSQSEEGGLNFIKFRNDRLDALLERAGSVLDDGLRKPLYDEVQQILYDEQPYLFLYVPYALPVVHGRFKGVEPAPAGILHNFTQWWVPKEQQHYKTSAHN